MTEFDQSSTFFSSDHTSSHEVFEKVLDQCFEVPGPGEVLSELSAGLRIKVLEGDMTVSEAQERFSKMQRELNLLALAIPNCPWETGSTQVRELETRRKELLAARKNNVK